MWTQGFVLSCLPFKSTNWPVSSSNESISLDLGRAKFFEHFFNKRVQQTRRGVRTDRRSHQGSEHSLPDWWCVVYTVCIKHDGARYVDAQKLQLRWLENCEKFQVRKGTWKNSQKKLPVLGLGGNFSGKFSVKFSRTSFHGKIHLFFKMEKFPKIQKKSFERFSAYVHNVVRLAHLNPI